MSRQSEPAVEERAGRLYFETWNLNGPKFNGEPSLPEPVLPPLRPTWKWEAPGQIGGIGVTNGRLLAAYGKSGWCVLNAITGDVVSCLEAGPSHGGDPEGLLLPDGKFALVTERGRDWAIIDFAARKSRRDSLFPKLFQGDALVVKEDRSGTHCLLNAGKLTPFPRHLTPFAKHLALYQGPAHWLTLDDSISKAGQPVRVLQAVNPDNGKVLWSKTFPSDGAFVKSQSMWIGVQVPVDDTGENSLEVLRQSDGSLLWKFPGLRDVPPGTKGGYINILHWQKPLGLFSLETGNAMRTYCVDLAKNKVLWTLPETAAARFCTGDILWTAESPATPAKGKKSYERDLVVRNILDGRELWRTGELDRVVPWRGRLYSWRGKTLTCWESVLGGATLPNRIQPPAVESPRTTKKTSVVVVKTRHGAMSRPEAEEKWREWFCCAAASNTAGQRLSVKALVEALRESFKNLTQLADGTIELYDQNDQFWGRISFERTRKSTAKQKAADDKVSAFNLYGGMVVSDIVGTILQVEWPQGLIHVV